MFNSDLKLVIKNVFNSYIYYFIIIFLFITGILRGTKTKNNLNRVLIRNNR